MAVESFLEAFQAISIKKRQGLLRIISSAGTISAYVCEGKIVHLQTDDAETVSSVVDKLTAAGICRPQVAELIRGRKISLLQLADVLVSKNIVSKAAIDAAARVYFINKLYSMRLLDNVTTEFVFQETKPDLRFRVDINAGQLILDMLELEADEELYRPLLELEDVGANVFERVEEVGLKRSDFEEVVWQELIEPESIENLQHKLISEFEFKAGLLSLVRRGAVRRVSENSGTIDIDDELRISSVEENEGSSLFSEIHSQFLSDADKSDLEFSDEEMTVGNLKSNPVEAASSAPTSEPKPTPSTVQASRLDDCLEQVQKSSEEVLQLQALEVPLSTIEQRFGDNRNLPLMLANNKQQLSANTMLAFLFIVLFCLTVYPGTLDAWFAALAEFSSAP